MTAVTIERIAAGGDGVGRLEDGMTVFVPRTTPGDRVELAVTERRRAYARARVRAWVARSADRVEPACHHYVADDCGGCQLQHVGAAAQLDAKRRLVGDAVRRIGKRHVADPEIVPSPDQWRYRRKITLATGGTAIGLHRQDAPGQVFDLIDCPITASGVMALWTAIRSHRATLPAGLTGLVLREDASGHRHVVVQTHMDRPWDPDPLARAVGEPEVTYWWQPAGGAARALRGGHTGFPALAFAQVNPTFGRRIRTDALDALGAVAGCVVWDLYAGVGDGARELAARGARVWAVEMDRTAVAWARKIATNASHQPEVNWITGRVEESLHRLPEPDAVIANPPRAGLHRRVTERLERWSAGRPGCRMVYVSCDPATLARDLARLPSSDIVRLTAYDLFPQTAHVEALVVLEGQ